MANEPHFSAKASFCHTLDVAEEMRWQKDALAENGVSLLKEPDARGRVCRGRIIMEAANPGPLPAIAVKNFVVPEKVGFGLAFDNDADGVYQSNAFCSNS